MIGNKSALSRWVSNTCRPSSTAAADTVPSTEATSEDAVLFSVRLCLSKATATYLPLLPSHQHAPKVCSRKQVKLSDQLEKKTRIQKSRFKLRSYSYIVLVCILIYSLYHCLDSFVAHDAHDARKGASKIELDANPATYTPALNGLGSVYRRGTKAMDELVVAHVSESASSDEMKAFLRTLHRSGLTARADVAFLFPWSGKQDILASIIKEEDGYFHELLSVVIANRPQPDGAYLHADGTVSPFDANAYRKDPLADNRSSEPVWGCYNQNILGTNGSREEVMQNYRWGSIVGFSVSELNPDESLHGFMDKPPVQLRRWACYQLLLGMLRHRFKQILLVDAAEVLILRDPLALARRKVGLYLSFADISWGITVEDLSIAAGQNASSKAASKRIRSDNSEHVEEHLGISTIQNASSNMRSDGSRHPPQSLLFLNTNEENEGLDFLDSAARRQLTAAQNSARRKGKRRRKSRKSTGGLYETVYGKSMWTTLEDAEKEKKLVNSGAIMGSLPFIRSLSNTMVTEIVKVALHRKRREPFRDSVLLSHIVHKSGVLGKKATEHLQLWENSESFVHSLVGSQQPSVFVKANQQAYAMVHGDSRSKVWRAVVEQVEEEICRSGAGAEVYKDCASPWRSEQPVVQGRVEKPT